MPTPQERVCYHALAGIAWEAVDAGQDLAAVIRNLNQTMAALVAEYVRSEHMQLDSVLTQLGRELEDVTTRLLGGVRETTPAGRECV